MKKNKLFVIIGVLIVVLVIAQILVSNKDKISNDKPTIVTSFYPLYYFTNEIAGNKFNIVNITPSDTEPHEYEPTPKDITTIENSRLLILNGAELEPWGENVLKNINIKSKSIVVSENLANIEGEGHHHEDHDEAEGHEEEHVLDPHIWLSPVLAQKIVDKIAESIINADPANSSYYKMNSETLKSKLSELDKQYKKGLAQCQSRNIITSHSAFGYMALAYDLKQVSIAGLSTEEEPSSKELAEVAEFAKKNNVKYIFFESLVSPKLSNTIANEVGAKTLVLNPIEGLTSDQIAQGKDYISEMYSNLANLKTALSCK